MHFIDNMQDSKRNLEQVQGKLGKKTKHRKPEEGTMKDLIEEMEELNKKSLAAKYEQGNPGQFIKFLDAKIALLDSITDVLTELYKIKSDEKLANKLNKWQPELDSCLDSAWRQLVQISQMEPATGMLPELDSKKPVIQDFIDMRHAITDWVLEFVAANFKKKVVEEKQKPVEVNATPNVEQPVFESPKQAVELPTQTVEKSIPIEPPRSIPKQSLHNQYPHIANNQNKGRWHALEIIGQTFEPENGNKLKEKYLFQKGDFLKTNILEEFKKQIEELPKENFDIRVNELKKSAEYQVLAKAQGLWTQTFGGKTSSVEAFDKMISERKAQFDEPNSSIQHK